MISTDPQDIEGMRTAGRLAAEVLDMISEHVKPGITTGELDTICDDYIRNVQGCIPAPYQYKGFPKSICTSVNNVVCHGIPGEKKLKKGDSLNIDITVVKDGYHGDTSRMFFVGKPKIQAKRLSDVCHDAMWKGIEQVKPGATLGDIGHAIQSHVESYNYSVVRVFCGHGIGKVFHEMPNVLHYGKPGEGETLVPGMFFTIEPMVNVGKPDVRVLPDGWTAVTKDRTLSAQWEHTIMCTEDGYEVMTCID